MESLINMGECCAMTCLLSGYCISMLIKNVLNERSEWINRMKMTIQKEEKENKRKVSMDDCEFEDGEESVLRKVKQNLIKRSNSEMNIVNDFEEL